MHCVVSIFFVICRILTLNRTTTSNPLCEYKGTFNFSPINNPQRVANVYYEELSTIETISELKFQLKCVACSHSNCFNTYVYIIFLEKEKLNITDRCYDVHIDLKINNNNAVTQIVTFAKKVDTTWHLLHKHCGQNSGGINCAVTVEVKDTINTAFAALYHDTLLTDFELRGENGNIPVHRTVLAMSSPVLKTFLESKINWLENRWYKFSETDISTLQHLKDYIYLGKLPEEGLQKLLLLASCYMMEDLENRCVSEIVKNITPENALEISEFAMAHKMNRLYLGFLMKVQSGAVKVDQIPSG